MVNDEEHLKLKKTTKKIISIMKSLAIVLLSIAAVVAMVATGVSISYWLWNYTGIKEFNQRITEEYEEDEL